MEKLKRHQNSWYAKGISSLFGNWYRLPFDVYINSTYTPHLFSTLSIFVFSNSLDDSILTISAIPYNTMDFDEYIVKLIDFLSYNYSKASRLQWLHGTNSLMVTSFHPTNENCCISLLDFRKKNMVALLWCDCFNKPYITDEAKFRDVLAIEKSNSICVVDENERLAFLDLRSMASKSVNWSRRSSSYMGKNSCYPKLAFHEGQLFSSMGDRISVYCGSDWVLTSQIRKSHGGPICDFSIGGDRLFALHSKEDVIDVWETPRPPII